MGLKFDRVSVLVVEDTAPMRKLIVSILETFGFGKIFTADDGRSGFEEFKKNNPDLILVDWLMRPTDGLELVKLVRTHPLSPNKQVPIIMITGYNALSRVREARDHGITEFLVKPFTARDLAKRISHVINTPRDFIDAPTFFGPDRRRRRDDKFTGPFRRSTDDVKKRFIQSDEANDIKNSEKWEIRTDQ
jgi:two-component system chemotaxis response regulator CheY